MQIVNNDSNTQTVFFHTIHRIIKISRLSKAKTIRNKLIRKCTTNCHSSKEWSTTRGGLWLCCSLWCPGRYLPATTSQRNPAREMHAALCRAHSMSASDKHPPGGSAGAEDQSPPQQGPFRSRPGSTLGKRRLCRLCGFTSANVHLFLEAGTYCQVNKGADWHGVLKNTGTASASE